jgi:acetolactate synthase-1/2/3 large subunit
MRVADFIALRLKHLGCRDVYMVTGGAAMHLNDAFGRHYRGSIHTLHHEQSCAIAAESYARVSGIPAIVNVTAGPGGINAINGVFGAFVDSQPMIVVSGQAKRETLVSSYAIPGLRQLGDQEVDIISMVSGICKYAAVLSDPLAVCDELDRCFQRATSGRPGPVWLDVPIDVQAFPLPEEFSGYLASDSCRSETEKTPRASQEELSEIAHHILTDKRPVLYVGSGLRTTNSESDLLAFLEKWPIATVTGWNSNDLLADDHPCYCGRPGTVGNRAGNFAVQYSECVVVVGCRLNIRQISFNWSSFAKNAWTCHVDIDRAELDKPTLNTQLRVQSTAEGFFDALSKELDRQLEARQLSKEAILAHWADWKGFNRRLEREYHPVTTALPAKERGVNPYRLVHALTSRLSSGAITVCADGTACVVGFQAAVVKEGQRLYHNSGCASMGYELPAAIGAYHASAKQILCISGDGSIMMNIQELAFIGGLSVPVKIILLNNQGYHSIRQTQRNYFPDNPVGCGKESGLPFPDFSRLCQGFSIGYDRLESERELDAKIEAALRWSGPFLLEVILDLEQDFSPKLASKKLENGTMVTAELEDMTPLLGDSVLSRLREEAFSIV